MNKRLGLGGQKKHLDAEINLTPFIDLLSTCICFLLLSAVWIQIGSVEIKQSYGTGAAETPKESFDLDVVFRSAQSLRLNLKKSGKTVTTVDVESGQGGFDQLMTTLGEKVSSSILNFKNTKIEIATATVTPVTAVDYGQLISTLDVLRKNKIVNIGIISAKEK